MKKLLCKITDEQKLFLETIIHEDAATNLSEAVQWCIDSCRRIEHHYEADACFVAFHDVTKDGNPEFGGGFKVDPEFPKAGWPDFHTTQTEI